jgi:cytochrome c5
MMKSTRFLIVLAAASLLACGKPEKPTVTSPPAAESPRQAEPQSAAPSTALTETPTAQPEAVAVEPSRPVAAFPASETPAAALASESAPTGSDRAHGQLIYRQACAFCHDKGIAGAPKIGDAAAWNARMAQGINTLYASALHGRNAMPAKGGNPSLADTDVKAAVDFMMAQPR